MAMKCKECEERKFCETHDCAVCLVGCPFDEARPIGLSEFNFLVDEIPTVLVFE